MNITHKIKMDLTNPGITPRISLVQGDTYTRKLSIALYAARKPWRIPSDASVVMRYRKPDNTSGTYDTLADGTSAVSFSGNTLTVLVAPEALSLAGSVTLMVTIICGELRLSTFSMVLEVEPDCVSGWTDEEGAAWIAAFLPSPANAKQGDFFSVDQVDETGHVLSVQPADPTRLFQEYLDENGIKESISISHQWDGTVLSVTSASGTSSADLKGSDGKSAYEYAVEGGFTGAEDAFAQQLAMGGAEEIVISSDAPVDENAKIWINPDEADEASGATSIDVTAAIGQTIIVKEVDENGKPTAWEAVEYQERICGEGAIMLLPETKMQWVADIEAFITASVNIISEGKTYEVVWNGVTYSCVAFSLDADGDGIGDTVAIGNPVSFGGEPNGLPFLAFCQEGMLIALPLNGETEASIRVMGWGAQKIDEKYLPTSAVSVVSFRGLTEAGDQFMVSNTSQEIFAAYSSGQLVFMMIGSAVFIFYSYDSSTGQAYFKCLMPDFEYAIVDENGKIIDECMPY